MSSHIAGKRRATVVAMTAVLVLVGGLAFAYWSSSGSGTGAGTTGTSSNFTVAGGAVTGPALTPGGASQSVAFTVANPGTGTLSLTSVTVAVAAAGGVAWVSDPEGCTAADYTLGAPAITYGQIAGGDSVSGTVTLTMNNLSTNQDACQGLAVPLYFVAS